MMNAIPGSVRQAAAALIRAQRSVPQSPLRRREDGSVELCAAAALVVAHQDQTKRDALIARFENEGRSAVIDAYSELNWPKELGIKLLQTNDALDEDRRRNEVLALFE